MKKTLFIAFLSIAFSTTLVAQEISDKSIGLRLGDNSGLGGEVSYQHKLNDVNRLEVNLGLRNNSTVNSYKLTGVYQWVWALENKFNWYAGFGGGIGSWKIKATDTSSTSLFAAGNVGIEYNFDEPFLISLDIRPEFGFNDAYDGLNTDIALGLRYQF